MITVFTPTYNRKSLLPRLYTSLQKQDVSNFEWLIVDDGSSDGTEEIVKPWLNNSSFPIRYIRKENGGKHTAFNLGVQEAFGDLFLCVDSDDYLADYALKKIENATAHCIDTTVGGIMALKQDVEGHYLGCHFPDELEYETSYRINQVYGCRGERTMIYKTTILRQYPYPVIPGEKFLGESVVYDQIDQHYRMYLLNEVITICEYQPDGLTSNIVSTMLNNPTGYKIYYAQRIDMALSWKERWGYLIRYCAFDLMSGEHRYNYTGPHRFAVAAARLPGWMLVHYYKRNK